MRGTFPAGCASVASGAARTPRVREPMNDRRLITWSLHPPAAEGGENQPPVRNSSSLSLRMCGSRSRRVPRESLDAPENLPKEGLRQVAFVSMRARPARSTGPSSARSTSTQMSELGDSVWGLGVCPFCGAPPGFGDLVEEGRRRLACHYCGGGWIRVGLHLE
jgi:hypothetical protein